MLYSQYDTTFCYSYKKGFKAFNAWGLGRGNMGQYSTQEVTSHSGCSVGEIRKQGLYRTHYSIILL